ncbi:MAG TPA: alpha/beta hydrolase [Terriglobia bacterium]|jgi:pimeloyl-ACP methyl ester carboxylesterase|nr:alpha/beta hydrolase [Terriglobia bacterium]
MKRGRRLRRALALVFAVAACLGAIFFWRPFWIMDQVTRGSLRLDGVRSDYVQLGSYRIHYLAGGEGRPLVLVHGLGGRAQDWALLMPALMRHDYRVYALDLLGFGQSQRPDVDYSIALQSEVLNQFFDSQHLSRADLGGWSMGGWVALKFTLAHPERVRRLVLFDSAGVDFKPAFDFTLFHPATVEQAEEFLTWLTPQSSRIPRFIARDMIREMQPTGWVVDRARKSMVSGADLLNGRLGSIQAPVLIVWGKQDVLIPLFCADEMHREMPQSSLAIFDGCGHLAPVECGGRIVPETLRFLEAEPPLPPSAREFPR